MKVLSIRQQKAVLRAMLRNFSRAVAVPRVAKAVLFARTYFDRENLGRAAFDLALSAGDVATLRREWAKSPQPWHANFFRWAESVKGGAL